MYDEEALVVVVVAVVQYADMIVDIQQHHANSDVSNLADTTISTVMMFKIHRPDSLEPMCHTFYQTVAFNMLESLFRCRMGLQSPLLNHRCGRRLYATLDTVRRFGGSAGGGKRQTVQRRQWGAYKVERESSRKHAGR
jgi:uncharacterized protein (DUF2236 family)